MSDNETKQCPYCAETIRAEAVKCRYCGSRVATSNPGPRGTGGYWRRVNEGKRLAGVCTGLSREFDAPRLVLPLRLFFVITSLLSGFGMIMYLILWLLMPAPEDRPYAAQQRPAAGSVPHDTIGTGTGTGRRVNGMNALAGFMLIACGILLLVVVSGGMRMPELHLFNILPRHWGHWLPGIPDSPGGWIPGIIPLLFIFGLVTLILGSFRFLRLISGCGLIVLAILMVPVLRFALIPLRIVTPLLVLAAVIMVIVGGLRLVIGSRPRE